MMGSGQSSGDKSGSFSIDPSGKISQPRTKRQQKDSGHDFAYSDESKPADRQSSSSFVEEGPLRDSEHQTGRSSAQLATLNTMPTKRDDSEQLRLHEVDEILTRMKAKYKPNSAEMAGKSRNVFEEIERSLIHCFKTNREQPLKCAKLTQEYKDYVEKQRAAALNIVAGCRAEAL